ncbi:MAG: PadR family transcriptional regulator [Acidimicrobiales bacterium]|nr:PadR family transcriptional regulator [Acidimicrobiales bacterium]
MTRLFGRGELKAAILDALGTIEPANGYAVMQTLADTVGGAWQPSPGAIYPALLALEDDALITSTDDGGGSRTYSLTSSGRTARERVTGTLATVAARAQTAPARVSLGQMLDQFAAEVPGRSRALEPARAAEVRDLLDRSRATLIKLIDKENDDG